MSYSKLSALLTASAILLPTTAFAGATPLVSVDWLSANQNSVDIIDVRSKLGLKEGQGYAVGHIPGAVKADYLKAGWRTSRDGVVGVLPETSELEALLSSLGVANDDHVVLVSSGNNARAFSMMSYPFFSTTLPTDRILSGLLSRYSLLFKGATLTMRPMSSPW